MARANEVSLADIKHQGRLLLAAPRLLEIARHYLTVAVPCSVEEKDFYREALQLVHDVDGVKPKKRR